MLNYIARRLLLSIPTIIAVLTLVFVIARIIPGDPALQMLGDNASAEALASLRRRLGLDQPLYVQYFDFLFGVFRGDLGNSMVSGKPVLAEMLKVLPYTIDLTVFAMVFGLLCGVPLGVISAIYRNTVIDYGTRIVSLLGLSFPPFYMAMLILIIFAIYFNAFPVISSGDLSDPVQRLHHLILPGVTLGLSVTAYITRVTRSSMLEVLQEDFVRTAKAKGVPSLIIFLRHGLRNALIPVVTVAGLYFGLLIGNSVVIEIVFTRPGLGKMIIGALDTRDYIMLQGLMVAYSLIVVLANLLTDLTYGWINPKVKYE